MRAEGEQDLGVAVRQHAVRGVAMHSDRVSTRPGGQQDALFAWTGSVVSLMFDAGIKQALIGDVRAGVGPDLQVQVRRRRAPSQGDRRSLRQGRARITGQRAFSARDYNVAEGAC